jgi:hypothetical protein
LVPILQSNTSLPLAIRTTTQTNPTNLNALSYTNTAILAQFAKMPCKAEGLVLTVDPNVIHKVDTQNAQNLFNMWTGK